MRVLENYMYLTNTVHLPKLKAAWKVWEKAYIFWHDPILSTELLFLKQPGHHHTLENVNKVKEHCWEGISEL